VASVAAVAAAFETASGAAFDAAALPVTLLTAFPRAFPNAVFPSPRAPRALPANPPMALPIPETAFPRALPEKESIKPPNGPP